MIKQFLRYSACTLAALALSNAASLYAATSFSNSLTGFTGDSTLPATQTAVAAAGFNFFSIEGFNGLDADPTVAFDTQGAHFGSLFAGDGGRNYMRTNDEDYATVNFTAEITFTWTELDSLGDSTQATFFGVGTGDTALFGVPDWSTQFASAFVIPEIVDDSASNLLTQFYTNNDVHNDFIDKTPTTLDLGTHRLQLKFDSAARTAQFAIDLDYAGGPFTADTTGPVLDLSQPAFKPEVDLFSETGWPGEPSRIFFGGDDNVVFKDFSVAVSAAPSAPGDFDADGDVDGEDFLAWQRGFGATTGATRAQGDANGDGDVDAADLGAWGNGFGESAGAAAVPEPAALVLATACGLIAIGYRKFRTART